MFLTQVDNDFLDMMPKKSTNGKRKINFDYIKVLVLLLKDFIKKKKSHKLKEKYLQNMFDKGFIHKNAYNSVNNPIFLIDKRCEVTLQQRYMND